MKKKLSDFEDIFPAGLSGFTEARGVFGYP